MSLPERIMMPCFDTNYSWQPIETAPDSERVMVCGFSPRSKSGTAAYWWYGEDVTFSGKPTDHPHALKWAPLVIPPLPEGEPS